MSRSPGRALALVAATALAVSALVAAPAASASATESAFVTKINAARAAAGLPAVSVSGDLVAAARRHSSAMAGRRDAVPLEPGRHLLLHVPRGERRGRRDHALWCTAAFMGSSGHRANILNPAMRQVGVGVVSSGGQLWVTEIFRARQRLRCRPRRTRDAASGSGIAERGPAGAVVGAVLTTRMARLSHRAAPRNRDPLASALAWSSAMRTSPPPR